MLKGGVTLRKGLEEDRYRKKGNMYKSEKLQIDNLVYVYVIVTVTLGGGQDKTSSSRGFISR